MVDSKKIAIISGNILIVLLFSFLLSTKFPIIIHELGHSFTCLFLMGGRPYIQELPEAYETICTYPKNTNFYVLFCLSGILAELIVGFLLSIIRPVSSFGGLIFLKVAYNFSTGRYNWDLSHASLDFLLNPIFNWFFMFIGAISLLITFLFQLRWWRKYYA